MGVYRYFFSIPYCLYLQNGYFHISILSNADFGIEPLSHFSDMRYRKNHLEENHKREIEKIRVKVLLKPLIVMFIFV